MPSTLYLVGGRPGREPLYPASLDSSDALNGALLQRTPSFDDHIVVEELAFAFASSISNSIGQGKVSLIELTKFMAQEYNKTAQDALDHVEELITGPKIPTAPGPPAKEPESEWVFKWMKTIFPDDPALVSNFGCSFRREGLVNESDLKIGPVLSCDVLKDVLKIQKLGHRRRIATAHAALIES